MKEATVQRLGVLCDQMVALASMVRKDTDEALATANPIEVIKHFDILRQANARIKEAREALTDMADALSTSQIPDLMRAASMKTVTVEGVGRVTVSYRTACSILDGKKEPAYEWLRGNDLGGIIVETVNSSTLAATAKDRLVNQGLDMPSDMFKVSSNPFTSITKVK